MCFMLIVPYLILKRGFNGVRKVIVSVSGSSIEELANWVFAWNVNFGGCSCAQIEPHFALS